jgi:hypothetical protein
MRKLFAMPQDAIIIIPNNDTRKNEFTSLHRNNFLLIGYVLVIPWQFSTDLERLLSSEKLFPPLDETIQSG